MTKRIHGFAVSNIGSERTVESYSLKKQIKDELVIFFDNGDDFADGSELCYSPIEVSDEHILEINKYYSK